MSGLEKVIRFTETMLLCRKECNIEGSIPLLGLTKHTYRVFPHTDRGYKAQKVLDDRMSNDSD